MFLGACIVNEWAANPVHAYDSNKKLFMAENRSTRIQRYLIFRDPRSSSIHDCCFVCIFTDQEDLQGMILSCQNACGNLQ